MLTTLLARTAHLTTAVVSATLLVAYATVLPVPANASAPAAAAAAAR